MQLTKAAGHQLWTLHNEENGSLQPLEAHSCADLISQLRAEVPTVFNCEPPNESLALVALEISRHLPDAHGWPTVQGALGCLERRTPSSTVNPSPRSRVADLMTSAQHVRQVYLEGPSRRSEGTRLVAEDGTDAEFAAPLALAIDLDRHFQLCTLDVGSQLSTDASSARKGAPADKFEELWERAAQELSEIVATAAGCSQEEALSTIRQNEGDCSASLLSILYNKGDLFQQQCTHASAIELSRLRQERSLKIIVEEAAKAGHLPKQLSSSRMLQALHEHLPLSEIMGHRYRVPARKPSGKSKVSFEEEEDGMDSYDDNSDDGRDSRYGASDASSFDGMDDDSDGFDSGDHRSDEDESESDSTPRSAKSRRERKSNLMAAPPPNWTDGDSPNGGFYLDTFTKVYQGYKSFTSLHGSSLTFKSLIQHDIEPTVMMELGIRSAKSYRKLSDKQLLKRIKACLGFQEDDYYARKLELLRLPACNQSKASSLYVAFRKLTTPFLRILREAEDSGARLRSSNVSRIFKNQIRGYPALERWFLSKRFKTFNDAVRHISRELHNRIATEVETQHDEQIVNGHVAGARTDIRGGKAEPGRGKGNHHQQNQRGSSQPPPKRARWDDRNALKALDSSDDRPSRPARSKQEEDEFQRALAKEKALPHGMYHHPRGPYCKENPCRAKLCQGCNYHAGPDGKGHFRPNCRCKDHPEFVPEGYFHDKHPNRTGALKIPASDASARGGAPAKFGPPPGAARVRHGTGKGSARD